MLTEKEKYHKIFNDNVLFIFGKVADAYGLKLSKVHEELFKLSLGRFDVQILLGWGHLPDLNIVIVLSGDEPKQKDYAGIGLLNFVEYQDPDYQYIDFKLKKPDELPQKLDTLAYLLRKYCDTFLKGDFSIWPMLVAFVEDKIDRKSR